MTQAFCPKRKPRGLWSLLFSSCARLFLNHAVEAHKETLVEVGDAIEGFAVEAKFLAKSAGAGSGNYTTQACLS
jgi:hypothetical protein